MAEGFRFLDLKLSDREREIGRIGAFIVALKDRLDAQKEARKRGEDPDLIDLILG